MIDDSRTEASAEWESLRSKIAEAIGSAPLDPESVRKPGFIRDELLPDEIEDVVDAVLAVIGTDLHREWRTECDLRQDVQKRLRAAEAKVARVEDAARTVVSAWDNTTPAEPCQDCIRSGESLLSAEDDARLDCAVDDLRAVLLEPNPAPDPASEANEHVMGVMRYFVEVSEAEAKAMESDGQAKVALGASGHADRPGLGGTSCAWMLLKSVNLPPTPEAIVDFDTEDEGMEFVEFVPYDEPEVRAYRCSNCFQPEGYAHRLHCYVPEVVVKRPDYNV